MGDLVTALYVVRESLRLLDDSLSGFLNSMLDLSPLWRLARRPALPVASED
jgi:hypothetical protein